MLHKKISSRYYLFSLSNLIAAFGGGMILGKGVGIIDLPWLQNGSVLAFFIGTILGLCFLQSIPEKLSTKIAKFFSFCGGITSLILFYIYQNYSTDSKINGSLALIFFALLSIRFGFWFYSRVMRASQASGQQQSIAWVELGYYAGMVLGLIIWKLLGINVGLGTALVMDACFQFIAGILDYCGNAMPENGVAHEKQQIQINSELELIQCNPQWCWRLAGAVIFTTIGIQVVIFNSSHYVSETFSAHIIGTFYFGVAAAAFICNKYKIYITWKDNNNIASIQGYYTKMKIGLLSLTLASLMAVIMAIYLINLNNPSVFINDTYNKVLICLFVFVAAFSYEIISLTILDRLGYEEKRIGRSGMIMQTYGLMGLGAAVSLWMLGLMENHYTSSIITILTLSLTMIIILKRKRDVLHPSNCSLC
ncbi:MAG: hypothetical protein Q8M03_10390 [Legionella sp.]|nr:hypothetical protein [Legionella sp.]